MCVFVAHDPVDQFEDLLYHYPLRFADPFQTRLVVVGHLRPVGTHSNALFCGGEKDGVST